MIQPSGCLFLLTSKLQDGGTLTTSKGPVQPSASSMQERRARDSGLLPSPSAARGRQRPGSWSGASRRRPGWPCGSKNENRRSQNQSGVCPDRTASCYVSSGFSSAAYPHVQVFGGVSPGFVGEKPGDAVTRRGKIADSFSSFFFVGWLVALTDWPWAWISLLPRPGGSDLTTCTEYLGGQVRKKSTCQRGHGLGDAIS